MNQTNSLTTKQRNLTLNNKNTQKSFTPEGARRHKYFYGIPIIRQKNNIYCPKYLPVQRHSFYRRWRDGNKSSIYHFYIVFVSHTFRCFVFSDAAAALRDDFIKAVTLQNFDFVDSPAVVGALTPNVSRTCINIEVGGKRKPSCELNIVRQSCV